MRLAVIPRKPIPHIIWKFRWMKLDNLSNFVRELIRMQVSILRSRTSRKNFYTLRRFKIPKHDISKSPHVCHAGLNDEWL